MTGHRYEGDDYLFVHENLVVTDGIVAGERVVFDRVDDEGREVLRRRLEVLRPRLARRVLGTPMAAA